MDWKRYDFANEKPSSNAIVWIVLITLITVFAVAVVVSVAILAIDHPRIAGLIAIIMALASGVFFRAARASHASLERIREAYTICTCVWEDGDDPGCPWHHPEGRKDNGKPTVSRTR